MGMKATDVFAGHGLGELPSVSVDSYNLDVRHDGEILNNRLRKAAFFEGLDSLRMALMESGKDPLGKTSSRDIGRKRLQKLLQTGDKPQRHLIESAMDQFAADMAFVIGHFLKKPEWRGVERIAIGGGFSKGLLGDRTITKAAALLKKKSDVDLLPIRHHADDAGLIGGAHLLPPWVLKGHDAMLCIDIGGTNLRVGEVTLNLDEAEDLSAAEVRTSDIWRHADDNPKRTATIETLGTMLEDHIKAAQNKEIDLVPVIAIGCPGVIDQDGSITRGAMNLPGGNWESERFNLPASVAKTIGPIGDAEPIVLMHNDAVMQGLSQIPWMQDVKRWGVMTIGTGLGNACFTNRKE